MYINLGGNVEKFTLSLKLDLGFFNTIFKEKMMKNRLLTFILSFILIFSIFPLRNIEAEDSKGEFRVGMEASYAPFNWTQTNDANGAVPIQGSQEYANGYDVQIAKMVADKLGKKLVIVKIEWDGLLPAVQSNKIDAIIAGMSPTKEREEVLDFTKTYYESKLVLVTRADGKYADAKSLKDFSGARVVGQLNTFHDSVIDQIPGVSHAEPMADFSSMRVAIESGKIDAYVAERPEGMAAELANPAFKMVELKQGFQTNPDDTSIAIGLNKGSKYREQINAILDELSSQDKQEIMDKMIKIQEGSGSQDSIWSIFSSNWKMFLRGTLLTVLLSLVGTIAGLFIGFIIAVIRTAPRAKNKILNLLLNLLKIFTNIYVQVIRGTPMMVQAVLFYYGLQLFFDINTSPMASAFIIVSINTAAYMAEVVRGGINAIDKGQVEAAKALGMNHRQTMLYIILPQVFKNIIPNVGNEFIVNIKDTSVLNVISVNELFFTTKSIAGANFRFFQTYFIASAIYLLLTLSITSLLRLLEKKLEGDSSYVKVDHDLLSSGN